MHEIFEDYIPDFTYCLVNNRDYSKEMLLAHEDEMSLIMLLNKIQNAADLKEFLHIPPEEINRIVRESPEAVIDIIVMVMQALCTKLNLSTQDTEECVKKVRTRDMGYLWENMEKIDVQASHAAAVQAKKELADAQAKLDEKQAELDDGLATVSNARAELATEKANAKARLENARAEDRAEIERLKALLKEHCIAQK